MSRNKLRSAVEECLKPLIGVRVIISNVEGGDKTLNNTPGTITALVLSPESGLLYFRVRPDAENKTEIDVSLDELRGFPDEPKPHHNVLTVDLEDVYDEEAKPQPVQVRYNERGVGFHFPGFGDLTTVDGEGEPVYIEYRDGVPTVVVWGDINQEDPTHVISLEDAAEAKREPE